MADFEKNETDLNENHETCNGCGTGDSCCGGTCQNEAAMEQAAEEEIVEELEMDDAAMWQDRAMRALAEIENIKHRAHIDVVKKSKITLKNFVNDLLPMLDNFDRAMEACEVDDKCSPELKNIIVGVQFIYQSALEAFAKHGVKKIETIGVDFDPTKHKAISFVEDKKSVGKVVKELQSGYMLDDEILREASVIVGK